MTVTSETKQRKQRTPSDPVRVAVDALKRLGPDALSSAGAMLAKEAPMSAKILASALDPKTGGTL